MKKILLFVPTLFFVICSFGQVKLNIWDKNPNVAKTVNKLNPRTLPKSFESLSPTGESIIYDKFDMKPFEVELSSGKKFTHKPTIYRGRDSHSIVNYVGDAWIGTLTSKSGKTYSMSSESIFLDTSSEKPLNCGMPINVVPKKTETKPTPPIGRLTDVDFYNKDIPINKLLTIYIEVDYDAYTQKFGSSVTVTTNYISTLMANSQLIFQREGLSIQMNKLYIRETETGSYRSLNSMGLALSDFCNKISSNIPTAPNAIFKHLITNIRDPGSAGLAYIAGSGNGFSNSAGLNQNTLCAVSSVAWHTGSILDVTGNLALYDGFTKTFTHEIGHNLGSQHTHWCGWYNDLGQQIGRIDSCYEGESPTSTAANCTNFIKDTQIPTIMSYCHVRSITTNTFLNGFGKYPRWVMRSNVYKSSFIPNTSSVPPTLTTTAASSISATSAISGGNITSDGGSFITERGICYSTTQNPSKGTAPTINLGTGSGIFSTSITGLNANTTYYVRAYAQNVSGISYGSQISFTTSPASIPTLSTSAISSITNNSAVSGGTISSDGGGNITSKGVVWSTSANPTISLSTKTNDGSGSSAFSSNMTGLSASTLYYVRSYATNSAGTGYGNQLTFTTASNSTIILSTTTPIRNSPSSFTSGGTITSDGGSAITSRGICYSTSPTPTISNNRINSGSGTGSYSIQATSLIPNTTYYVRAFAINANGTFYGQEESVTTFGLPTVSMTLNSINQEFATFSITVTNVFEQMNILIFSLNDIVISQINTNPNTSFGGRSVNLDGTYSLFVARKRLEDQFGYTTGQTFQARATLSTYATSNVVSFVYPSPTPPVLTTLLIQDIQTNTAFVNSTIQSNNGPLKQSGYCYSTSPNPTITNGTIPSTKLESSTSFFAGTFFDLSGATSTTPRPLLSNTVYYVRAFCRNSDFTSYSNEIVFRTLINKTPPTLTLQPVTNITRNGATFTANITSGGLGACKTTKCRGFVVSKTNLLPSIDFSNCNSGPPDNLPVCISYFITPEIDTLTPSTFTFNCQSCIGAGGILEPNTTYNIRAFVKSDVFGGELSGDNPSGTTNFYSNVLTFKTLSTVGTPVVNSYQTFGSNPSSTTSGNYTTDILSDGGASVTSRGICWSTSPNPTIDLPTKINSGTGTSSFNLNITGLTPSTTYYLRGFATNSVGTSYSPQRTFTTTGASGLATLTTTAASNITSTTASSGGNISSQGGSTVTARGICFATTQNPTTSNQVVNSGTGTGTFSSNLTGLTPGTLYYVRAFATNSAGTAYGSQISFTTLSLPTVSTTSASTVGSTTATTGGNVTSDGGATITERGVCYATTSNPTTGNLKLLASGTTGSFTSNLTGLLPSTTYFVRAYAINSVGTQYGTQIQFTTTALATQPTVTTTSITNITSTTATSGGNVTSDGGATVTSRGVVWSTSPSPTIDLTTKTSNGTGTGTFTSSITGLSAGVLYYVRAYATNSIGTSYGSELTFTSTVSAPTLDPTTSPTNVTQTTASSGGNVTSTGGATVTVKGVIWSTSQNPLVTLTTKTNDGSGPGPFTSNITGLSPNTLYYVRAYATNSVGTSYGTQTSFTTLSATTTPTVNTTTATNITTTSATSGGQVTSDGGATVTARGVVWSTLANPLVTLTTKTQDGTGVGTFSSTITGLSPATLYYYRAYATNSNGTSYGTQLSFTTTANLPTVTTTSVTSIGLTSAVSGGNVTASGGATVTARGVIWSTSPNPLVTLSTKTVDGSGTGVFTSNITGLLSNTLYYVRAYATSSAGTAYGSQLQFTTSSLTLPQVTTTNPTNIQFTTATSGGNVTNDGGAAVTSRGVCWSTSPNPTLSNSFTVNGSGLGLFTSSLTNLSPGITYYIKAYATNSVGTAFGNEVIFNTLSGQQPQVSTDAVNNITTTNAEIVYSLLELGGGIMIRRGFCYSTSPNPTIESPKIEVICNIPADCQVGQYTSSFTISLSNNTTYYVRAFAENEFGIGYGDELSFTTLIDLPILTTTTISSITSTSAVSGGVISNLGGGSISAKGVCWSTSPNPTISNSFTNDGSGPDIFVSNITGLSPGVLYYVRAYATNQGGTNYGNQLTFTTSSVNPPILTTNSVTSITTTSAVSGGVITSDGGSPVTSRGVCWSTSQNPTIANSRTLDGSGTGTFTSSITGLVAGTTYYVRAYATSSAGTGYGQQNIFTTTGTVPTVSTNSVTNITTTGATCGGNVTSSGGSSVTARGVIWSTSPNPLVSLSTKTTDGSGLGLFSSNITGLLPSTLYYVRAYATNASGTGYGTQQTFTTSSTGGGTCAITGLNVTSTNKIESFSFNINPSCTNYTINVCRYSNTNPSIPPTLGQTPTACAIRNNNSGQSFTTPTSSEILSGVISRQMSPQPANTGFWYSVDITCNGNTCTGTKTTRSSYFYNAP